MPGLVSGRLHATLARMVRVEQYARSERFVVGEQSGNAAVEPPDVHPDAKLQLKQRHHVGHGPHSKAQAVSQFRGVLLGLRLHIAGKKRTLGRIVLRALDAQKVLQLYFGLREIRQQVGGLSGGGIFRVEHLPKAGSQVDVHGLLTQQGIDRRAVGLGEFLQLAHPQTALSLLDCHKCRARYVYGVGCALLCEFRVFTGDTQARAKMVRAYLFKRIHVVPHSTNCAGRNSVPKCP